jgi:hypothetical protein
LTAERGAIDTSSTREGRGVDICRLPCRVESGGVGAAWSRRTLLLAALATVLACGSSGGASTSAASSGGGPTHAISGTVTGASAVTVTVTSSGLVVASVLTGAAGAYSFAALPAGSYQVTASKPSHAFVPANREAVVSDADVTGLDFAGTLVTYSICGRVVDGAGAAISAASSGAVVATTTADASGSYCLAGLLSGLYAVTPSMDGYTFSPSSRDVAVSGADVAGRNFTADPVRYAISGTVAGGGYATVTLAADGVDVEATTTDAAGYYVFADLPRGSYAVRASADGSAFNPSRREVTLSGSDVRGQDFAAGQWRWQNPLPQGNTFNGIWGSRADDVWAVGNGGTILHWDGKSWTGVASGSTAHLRAVWGSGSTDVWAVGTGGTALHWDGSSWTKVASGVTVQLNGVWGSSSADVWAVGGKGTILRWRGAGWEDAGKNGGSTNVTTYDLNGVWGTGSGDVWAVGQFDLGNLHYTKLHWDGGAWTSTELETVSNASSMRDYLCVWGTEQGFLYTCDSNVPGRPLAVWGLGNDYWEVSAGGMIQRSVLASSGYYDRTPFPGVTENDLRGVWGSAMDDVWTVGEAGIILHWDGRAWTSFSSGPTDALNGVHGLGADDVWAVGLNGTVLRWDGGDWAGVSTGFTVDLAGVWSTRLDGIDDVWAVGPGGVILHGVGSTWTFATSGSEDFTAVWGSGPNDIWAVGAAGAMVHGNGFTWTAVPSKTENTLHGVWGSADDDAWAVGAGGTILRWQGAGWNPVASGTDRTLRGVWGASATDVWAVGEAGVILHWDGAAWSGVSSGIANDLLRVWGSWTGDVWAVGTEGVILRWDGTNWNAVTSGTGNTLTGVWGSGPTDVHVVGDIGTILGWR